jgi:hypothetical protein
MTPNEFVVFYRLTGQGLPASARNAVKVPVSAVFAFDFTNWARL